MASFEFQRCMKIARCAASAKGDLALDLDEDFRDDQPADLDHARRRANVPEEFAVCPTNLLPLANVHDVHAGPHHLLQRRTQREQRRLDVLGRVNCLRTRVAFADDASVLSGRRLSNRRRRATRLRGAGGVRPGPTDLWPCETSPSAGAAGIHFSLEVRAEIHSHFYYSSSRFVIRGG
jgi:hypothetical protein